MAKMGTALSGASRSCVQAALISCVWAAPELQAAIFVGGGMSGQMGELSDDETHRSLSGFAYAFHLQWQPEWNRDLLPFHLGISGRQAKLEYKENSVDRRATLNTLGPTLGLNFNVGTNYQIQVGGAYYTSPSFSAVSTNRVMLNGSSYRYATWEAYKTPAAQELRITLAHDKMDGQFNRRNRFRSGMTVNVFSAQFESYQNSVTTSKDSLTPTSTSSSFDSDRKLQIIGFEFFLGLSF